MENLVKLAVLPLAVVVNAFVLSVLWRWFVVPTFGAPELLMWQAAGLSLVVGFYTGGLQHDPTLKELPVALVYMFLVKPAALLGVGSVILWFS